jgi:hypothetical protein
MEHSQISRYRSHEEEHRAVWQVPVCVLCMFQRFTVRVNNAHGGVNRHVSGVRDAAVRVNKANGCVNRHISGMKDAACGVNLTCTFIG